MSFEVNDYISFRDSEIYETRTDNLCKTNGLCNIHNPDCCSFSTKTERHAREVMDIEFVIED